MGMYLAFCSGVPTCWIAVAHNDVALTAVAMPAQPQAISSVTIICVTGSVTPPPPYSSE